MPVITKDRSDIKMKKSITCAAQYDNWQPGMTGDFRNMDTNVHFTKGLFYELEVSGRYKYTMFTLGRTSFKIEDRKYYSLYELYMSCSDPTEYEFASTWLGGWDHWQKMVSSPALINYVERWREEMEVRTRSRGLKQVLHAAADGNYNASKYVSDGGWIKKRGRPSKVEIEGEKRKTALIHNEVSDDAKRLGIH